MNEKQFEQAQELEQRQRDRAIEKRVRYHGHHTHCMLPDCGEELPPARQDIGLCLDCAEDLERERQAHERIYGKTL